MTPTENPHRTLDDLIAAHARLRAAALALAEVATRNTDNGDEWTAAIEAVRRAAR